MSILDNNFGYPRFRLTAVPHKSSSSRAVISFGTLDDKDVVVKTRLSETVDNSLFVYAVINVRRRIPVPALSRPHYPGLVFFGMLGWWVILKMSQIHEW